MYKKTITFRKGHGATMDDLDEMIRNLPLGTKDEEAFFRIKCKVSIEWDNQELENAK